MGRYGTVVVCGSADADVIARAAWSLDLRMTIVPAIVAALRLALADPDVKVLVMDAVVLQGLAVPRVVAHAAQVPTLGVFEDQVSLSDGLAGQLSDFIVMPCSVSEVRIRIARTLRATPTQTGAGDFDLDPAVGASYLGREIGLTRAEHQLLAALLAHRGQVLSKQQLVELCLGYDGYDHNVVEVRVSRLRRKLRSVGAPSVETVRGFGYRLTPRKAVAAPDTRAGNGQGTDRHMSGTGQ